MIVWLVCLGLMSFTAVTAGVDSPTYYLRLMPDDYKAALAALQQNRSYDIAGVDRRHGSIDLLVDEAEYLRLQEQYPLEILDVFDANSTDRVDPQYKDPAEVVTLVQQYNASYPQITRLLSIGQSEQNRPIYAMKISDNALLNEDEPVVLFNAQHHAREVMTTEIALDIIEYLCTHYGSDPIVTQWVNDYEIWVVPQVNVDGANYVFTSYDMWRKDRHSPPSGSSCYGIDPNRDYPAFWAACGGSSGDPCDETYRGAVPQESYCVTHMINFASQIKPIFDISYHTYSELIIYPYGCSGDYTPEHEVVSAVGNAMASIIERDAGGFGYDAGTSWETLYDTDGGDIDWYYAVLGTFAYVIEVNSSSQGFLPNYNQWRNDTVERLRVSWQYLLNRLEGPAVTGHVLDACTGEPVQAQIAIQEYPLTADETPRVANNFGRFYRILNPGTYHLQVSAAGYSPATIPVTIGSSKLTTDVALVPTGAYGLYLHHTVIHDETGDQDGIVDPGETVAIEVVLSSVGMTTNVSAQLATADPYAVVLTSEAFFGTIPDGMFGGSQSPHFVLAVNPLCPEQHTIELELTITADQQLCIDHASFSTVVTSYVYECPIHFEPLTTNPGYEIINSGSNGWAYGHPTSGPANGYTGPNCYATNLTGNYGNNGNYQLISTPFDCSDITNAELYFWRWLRNESGYDEAYVEISTNHTNWTALWTGYAWDTSWTQQSFDISDLADGQPTVYVRWRLTSDYYVSELGYYVDDISICGRTLPPITPTPLPTWTPLPPTPTVTATPTVTPTPTLTGTPSPLPPTETPSAQPTQPPETPTPEPTSTPLPGTFSASLTLNQTFFEVNDPFLLQLSITNRTLTTYDLDQYLILDVYGLYFFHPSWGPLLDYTTKTIPPNYIATDTVLDFIWPSGAGTAMNLRFWLGFLQTGTQDLVGQINYTEFGYNS